MRSRSVCILIGLNTMSLNGHHKTLTRTLLCSSPFHFTLDGSIWDEFDVQVSDRVIHELLWMCAYHFEIPFCACS